MAKSKKGSIGCLFWIALILLVIVIFMFNQKSIARVVSSTGICKYIPKLPFCKEEDSPENTVNYTEEPESAPEPLPKPAEKPEKVVVEVDNTPEPEAEKPEPENTVKMPEPEKPREEVVKKKMRKSKLYYVRMDNDGTSKLEIVEKPVYYVDAPLTETLHALLEGLSTSNIDSGLISTIPSNTMLLSSPTIKNGIVYLNFNNDFTSSAMGKESLIFRLRQVIYTCTEFPTVSKVQFLINGKVQAYLSSDGIAIGVPMGRGDV